MSNAKALEEMCEDFWAYLTGSPKVAALGFKLFKGIDGNRLPIGADGQISATDLPALFVHSMKPHESDEQFDNSATQQVIAIQLECGVIYGNTAYHVANSSYECLSALMTIQDALRSPAARTDTEGLIDAFRIGEVEDIPSMANPRLVLNWIGNFEVVLKRLITFD